MKYAHIVAELYSRGWALRPEVAFGLKNLIESQTAGIKFSSEEIEQRVTEANAATGLQAGRSAPRATSSGGTVAVIPIQGVISHRMNMVSNISSGGGTSIEKLTAQFREAMNDTNCKAIIFDVDSPGGSVEGVMELASEIYQARGKKDIVAVANAQAASAAYWLATAAKTLVVTPSGQVGSIGVYVAHQDESAALESQGVKISLIKAGKYKTEGNPLEPLSDEARAALQAKVDDYYSMFVKAVATQRGDTQANVRNGYGEGRMLLAQQAVKENMADRVATFDEVLSDYGVGGQRPAQKIAAEAPKPSRLAAMRREMELH